MGRRVRHSREFKLEAVRLLELGQKSPTQLALELGVRRNQLYKWKEQLTGKGQKERFVDLAVSRPGGGRGCPAEARVAKVTEERDILKKAAAYFARELP